MFSNSVLLDLACRASNLSERSLIVKQLIASKAQPASEIQLSAFDTWNIKNLAGKLATQLIKNLNQQEIIDSVNLSIVEELQKLLTEYKLYELNVDNLSEADRQKFIQPHSQWLKTYQAALATLDLPKNNFSENRWYVPEIYYGNFGKLCEPFLRLLHTKLQSARDYVHKSVDNYHISSKTLNDIELHLLNRFEMALAWAIEAEINLYCSTKKITKSSDDVDAYIAYFEQSFNNKQDYNRFYCKFPVLARWLSQVTSFLCNFGEELIQNLTSDRNEISSHFFNNKQISEIKSFKLGKSDYHAGGKSVVIVELELTNSQPATIVYKPRCIKSEAAMQGLLENLMRDEVLEFGTYQLLCKDGYGYAEFIPSSQNNIQSEKEIERFYRQLGGYLGIFYILGGGDLHYENILVAHSNAFICDCETVLEVLPQGRDEFSDTVFDSVFKTAMLEWPRPNQADASTQMSISGYSGGESYEIPFTVPKLNDSRMSLAVGVKYQSGIWVESEPTNRVYYNNQLVNPQDYKNSIVDGFNQIYKWFQENPERTASLLLELFSSSLVRFINWGTQAYFKLIVATRHPKCLADPLQVDLLFNSLIEHRRQWDEEGKLAELELAAMWKLDIPIFVAKATSSDKLIYNYHKPLPNTLEISPIDNAIRRIQKLSTENQIRQNQYIYTSLSTEEINNPYFIASAVNYARQIGWQLLEMLQPKSNKAPWKTYEFTALGKRFVDISADIYDGTAGISLFLAYLDAIEPQPEFRTAAERALAYSIEQRNTTTLGAFQGAAGLIYLLTHLAQLWNKPELLDLGVNLSNELIARISEDTYFDILHGVAGIIPVMLNLAEATSGKGLDCAEECAQHLLKHAINKNDTLSWVHNPPELAQGNLGGFSHGAGGIGWALIWLGSYTNQSDYIVAGRQSFAYEASLFDPDERDWYDLRTSALALNPNGRHYANAWCSGAMGISLSRISSWAILGKTDDDILRDAYMGLNATLRNFQKLGNDSLCHGKSGNTELLLRFAKLRDEPYLQMEANVQAQEQWRNFEKARRWICGTGSNDILPGLMLGLAGVGMHFLRLAYPEQVPSPLLLDPFPKLGLNK